MTAEGFNSIAGGAESIATMLALVIGAYWTYTRFIKQRENFAFLEFTADMHFVGQQDGKWIVELIAYLENKGKVQHQFSDLSFELAALFRGDTLESSQDFGGQALFPHQISKGPWIPAGKYFIEPGVKAKYSYIAHIPAETTYLMLHGHFTYKDQAAWHTAERTLAVPGESNRQVGPADDA